jgi:hypothetical protein
LIAQLSNTASTTSPNTDTADDSSADVEFDALIGYYYNFSCPLTPWPNDNPAGGKSTRNPKLVLPVRKHNSIEHAPLPKPSISFN